MKKIINNRVYDTETAVRVGVCDNGYPGNSFSYCREELYRKKTGEYFLYGEGGAFTRYAMHRGGSTGSGEAIIPFSPAEAREWAEKNIDADDYIAEFGEPGEDDKDKAVMTISISAAARRKLEITRRETGEAMNAIIERLIMQ